MNSKYFINTGTVIVFLVCLLLGYQLSLRKALWGDELNTQVSTIEKLSWSSIIKGEAYEGNNAPLYYLLQKAVLTAAKYRLPFIWNSVGDGKIYDPASQGWLRLTANVCMSLSMALITRYFWVNFSPGAAALSLLTCFSSYMVLAYWAEARPYALWFLLTTVQLLTFLRLPRSLGEKDYRILGGIHCLLALTTVISAGQIAILSLLLWINGNRKKREYVLLTVIPASICTYFFYIASLSGVLHPYIVLQPWGYLHQAVALDQLLLIIILGAAYWACARTGMSGADLEWKNCAKVVSYGVYNLIFFGLLLVYFKSRENPGLFRDLLDSRSFIFLTPVGIVMVVFFIVQMFRFLRQHGAGLWLVQFAAVVSFFYVIRALLVYQDIYTRALFAY